jgi:hypothetical protein
LNFNFLNLKSVSTDVLASRLLLQASFGATREEISALAAKGANFAEAWLDEQMDINRTPPSMLRQYVRARMNPRF